MGLKKYFSTRTRWFSRLDYETYLGANGVEHKGVKRGDVEVENGEEDGLKGGDDL